MTIPSGGGTEVIKHFKAYAVSTSAVLLIPSPAADHIYTVLSIIWSNTTSGAEAVYLKTFSDSGLSANEFWVLRQGDIPAYGTYVWNDRFSFSGELYLATSTGAVTDIDVFITYIDQDWT